MRRILAVSLCLLGGGDALDLAVMFDISPNYYNGKMYQILSK